MNALKRVVAITLCFCLLVLSSSSVRIDAAYNHKDYVGKVNQYLEKKGYYVNTRKQGSIITTSYSIEDDNGFKNFALYLCKNKKSTKKAFKKMIIRAAKKFNSFSNVVVKKPNKNTYYIVGKYRRWYTIFACKMNVKKCRVVFGGRDYNHMPKKKTINKTKKRLKRMVNKINSF